MASQRLALNLQRSLRSRQALNAIRSRAPLRRYANPVEPSRIECTTLSNGLTVSPPISSTTIASEHSPWAQTSTVGVWIDAGSRAETDKTNGTAHFLEHLAFKGTGNRTQQQLELEIENLGGHLNAYTSRENTVYYAKSFNKDVPKTVDILSDILLNSKIEPAAVERERDVIIRESEEVDKQLEEVVFDHLHATAYLDQPLGRTILGPRENILSLTRQDLVDYITANYTADRMVLVSAGGIPHQDVVALAEKHLAGVKSRPPTDFGETKTKPRFVGSEVRIRDDTLPTAHIAIAVEGVSWRDDDYFTALVTQAIVGNWDRTLGQSPYMGSRLSTLWGIYLVSENKTRLDDLVHFALREWSRLSLNVSEAEVERAKAQLKASILLSLDGTTAIAEDIGRQIITTGRHAEPSEIERVINRITADDVMRWAEKKLWDQDIAISAVGRIEGLLDYQRIRSDMSRDTA
ncbi:hypothetical protein DV737_g3331, partial [Chaetothyriales sp. CBS 132003]